MFNKYPQTIAPDSVRCPVKKVAPAPAPKAVKKPSPKPKAVSPKPAPAPAPVIVERIEEVYSTPEETVVVETVVITENEMPETGAEETAETKEEEPGKTTLF